MLLKRKASYFRAAFFAISRTRRSARLTASESGNDFAISGSSRTTFVPCTYRAVKRPRVPPLNWYSGSMSESDVGLPAFSIDLALSGSSFHRVRVWSAYYREASWSLFRILFWYQAKLDLYTFLRMFLVHLAVSQRRGAPLLQ